MAKTSSVENNNRRRKLTKRLMATPMSRAHYLTSYLIWRLIVMVVEVVVPIAFGAWVFGVPVRGSLLALAIIAIVASLSFSSQALLMASRSRYGALAAAWASTAVSLP